MYYTKEASTALASPKCKRVKESKAIQTRHTIPVPYRTGITGTMLCGEKAEEAANEASDHMCKKHIQL